MNELVKFTFIIGTSVTTAVKKLTKIKLYTIGVLIANMAISSMQIALQGLTVAI